jgi:hypothetical protein
MRCRFLSLLVACFLVAFFTTDFGRGWCLEKNQGFQVSEKNQGFQVSESRQNRVWLNVSNWMMGALNGRSETGSETEQVGSGMNGRRQS